jgi:hypothetical protein
MVEMHDCGNETRNYMEKIVAFATLVILQALCKWKEWYLWCHMNCLLCGFYPSIRIWDEFNGKSSYNKGMQRRTNEVNEIWGHPMNWCSC